MAWTDRGAIIEEWERKQDIWGEGQPRQGAKPENRLVVAKF